MKPENEIFETCNSNQTETELKTGSFEPCDNNQTKTGRGGYRKNSGAKSSGIETVTVRIDKRLLNTVTRIKAEFKDGNLNLNDLFAKPERQDNDAKLLKKIARLECDKEEMRDGFFKLLESGRTEYETKIKILRSELQDANNVIRMLEYALRNDTGNNSTGGSGNFSELISKYELDKKSIMEMLSIAHPDRNNNSVASTRITQILNDLKSCI